MSGLRCCSPGRTLASPAGSGTEPGGVASGGPDRWRAGAVWGASERAEGGRRRRGRSRGDQAPRRTTPRRSAVRSSPSLLLRRRSPGSRAEAQGQLRGPARPLAPLWPAGPLQRGSRSCGGLPLREQRAQPAGRCHRNGLARAAEVPGVGGGEACERREPQVGRTVERTRPSPPPPPDFGIEVLWCGDREANGRRWSQWALERPDPGRHDLIPSFCNHGIPPTGPAALKMTVLGHPRSWSCQCLPVLILLLGAGPGPGVEGVTHYKPGDPVILYVNKVGPYHNPQETYHYYQLPVCCPEKIRHKSLSLGEVLDGDRMAESLYEIRFRENAEKRILCHMQLSSAQVSSPH